MILNFLRSFLYAFSGMKASLKERNMRFHVFSACIVVITGFLTHISAIEWMILLLIMALVIAMEMVNTAIESVVDLVSPDKHPLAKLAKDVAAGAVLVCAIASIFIGLIIFIPKWF